MRGPDGPRIALQIDLSHYAGLPGVLLVRKQPNPSRSHAAPRSAYRSMAHRRNVRCSSFSS